MVEPIAEFGAMFAADSEADFGATFVVDPAAGFAKSAAEAEFEAEFSAEIASLLGYSCASSPPVDNA